MKCPNCDASLVAALGKQPECPECGPTEINRVQPTPTQPLQETLGLDDEDDEEE